MQVLHSAHFRLSQPHQPHFPIEQIHEKIVFASLEVTNKTQDLKVKLLEFIAEVHSTKDPLMQLIIIRLNVESHFQSVTVNFEILLAGIILFF